MKIYNPGTLIILKNDYDHITYRGIILSLNECDSWWGGGYYNMFWSPSLTHEGNDNISYNQIVDWERIKEAVVYPIE
jgi:hypothetical protein